MEGFQFNTRRKVFMLPAITCPSAAAGGMAFQQLPPVGFLSRIHLVIRGTFPALGGVGNALGKCSIIRQIRLYTNSNNQIFEMSGAQYHWLLREMLDSEYFDQLADGDARAAVAAGAFNLDVIIPVALNRRDAIGLINLQSDTLRLTLEVTFESPVVVGGAGTGAYAVNPTAVPYLEVFSVPTDPRNWPRIDLIHQCLGHVEVMPGAGQYAYQWPKGNVYLQVAHGAGIGAAGADNFSFYNLRVQQSDSLQLTDPLYLDREHWDLRGRARPLGGIYWDGMATSGLGTFGLTRDLFDSALVSDLASVVTALAGGNLETVRRQLVALAA